MKKTDVFDRLDNVLGNYAENKATSFEVYQVAYDVNKYLIENPHPHDSFNCHCLIARLFVCLYH